MNKLVVVGDKFNEFAKLDGTITLSQLAIMAQMPAKVFNIKNHLFPGLGCKNDEISKFNISNNSPEHLDLSSLFSFYGNNFAPNIYTHQHNTYNVLIGQAKKLDQSNFELPFILDERNMLMGDHQTGSHVQGMIITEAFRQTFIAITEEFFLAKENKKDTYFVINEMNVNFENFLFPLPAIIHFELLDIDQNNYRSKLKAKITIKQANKICATMLTSYVVYPAKELLEKESKLAKDAVALYLIEYKSFMA
ncbi:AfsA-related hotdog domain-containing protein [Gilliamella sp. CG16]|uniref:AfsA-related hotdog domain-containing protein n=1 Tax=Gilliamella sp. CG16 TaxID=3351503 RepID=UPI003987ECC2